MVYRQIETNARVVVIRSAACAQRGWGKRFRGGFHWQHRCCIGPVPGRRRVGFMCFVSESSIEMNDIQGRPAASHPQVLKRCIIPNRLSQPWWPDSSVKVSGIPGTIQFLES